ncbi:hypothetical protein G4V39_02660 [Thermosulfuriphilus ammonigenes]|uniref:Uncharacterized protein n=1 Tax=Thermosulfuriphilus ammonigenes TaxID=1936021 RepID=A0A6G7PUI3_9BACT|nr:PGPGW domain-containing protein [Thermosulfuriphilus ammonigenes]MBA2848614.1 tellurite resistance protein TerC [Thermosulfuriphilus ammonigenes]QIJ71247.1 hypothetical protein G4V39_02660 [Thermosulfuriphilus ammonigenes]
MRQIKRLVKIAFGLILLLIGVAMIVLPGPATVVIPLALGILSSELPWAKRLLDWLKARLRPLIRRLEPYLSRKAKMAK